MPQTQNTESLRRWRLLLGAEVEPETGGLSDEDTVLDEALSAIYDETENFSYGDQSPGGKQGGRGKSAPMVARWLGDIRRYFKEDVVSILQNDAMERKGLNQLLLEPEVLKTVKPDLNMVTTLMALKNRIPEKAKETAREIVRAVVEEIQRRLENDIRRAVVGALNRRAHSPIPSASALDFRRTINKNLSNYDTQRKKLIPSRFYFFDRSQRRSKWHIILCMDQSGSMADSVVYGSVAGCILASISAVRTDVIAFDTDVVNLTEACGADPVDMIFGVQLGGGTDINKAVAYCSGLIADPKKTVLILLSDMFEGGNRARMLARVQELCEAGVRMVGLLALTDKGRPCYDSTTAKMLTELGMPCFACTPNRLPELLEKAVKGMAMTLDEPKSGGFYKGGPS